MPRYGAMNTPEFTVAITSTRPVCKCRLFILFLTVLLTGIGGGLAASGYNGALDRSWGHVGLSLLCIGSLICSIAYGYVTFKEKVPLVPVSYQRLPNLDIPTSSEYEQPMFENKPLPVTNTTNDSKDSDNEGTSKDGAECAKNLATKELLSAVADILEIQPPLSPNFGNSDSESTVKSKDSLYTSAELPQNETAQSSTEAEMDPLLAQKDNEFMS